MGKDKDLTLEDMTNEKGNTYINNAEDEQNDKISLMAITELLNKDNLKSISRLKFEQVAIIAKLHLFADVFGVELTKDLADLISELQISTNGLGRKELVQLVQRRDMFGINPEQVKKSKDIFR